MIRPITLALAVASLASGAGAQLINDGDFDDLDIGTPPDVGTPAGAWAFPQNYVDAGIAEAIPENYAIVDTTSFDPNQAGNSLAMTVLEAEGNYHLPNILTETIDGNDGLVTVNFRMWIQNGSGGGSVYVGGDHGGGGFSNASDRGPQITFFPDGTVQVWDSAGAGTVVANYSFQTWQNVSLTIDLVANSYDMVWGEGDQDPMQVVSDQEFRSGELKFIDRFSYVRFAGEGGVANAFLDDVEISVEPAACPADCNGDDVLNINDFVCFQGEWQNQTAFGDCNGDQAYDVLDFVCYQNLFQQGCP